MSFKDNWDKHDELLGRIPRKIWRNAFCQKHQRHYLEPQGCFDCSMEQAEAEILDVHKDRVIEAAKKYLATDPALDAGKWCDAYHELDAAVKALGAARTELADGDSATRS